MTSHGHCIHDVITEIAHTPDLRLLETGHLQSSRNGSSQSSQTRQVIGQSGVLKLAALTEPVALELRPRGWLYGIVARSRELVFVRPLRASKPSCSTADEDRRTSVRLPPLLPFLK